MLLRAKFRRYIRPEEVDDLVELIRRESISVEDPPASGERLSEDPGGEYLIRLARAARVDALVSGDPHLLRLRRLIPVITPRELLDSLDEADR